MISIWGCRRPGRKDPAAKEITTGEKSQFSVCSGVQCALCGGDLSVCSVLAVLNKSS